MELKSTENVAGFVKSSIVSSFARHGKDTGSSEIQIALLTARVAYLTNHLRSNKKDFSALRQLIKIVAKRKKLARYLHKSDKDKYVALLSKIGLTKI